MVTKPYPVQKALHEPLDSIDTGWDFLFIKMLFYLSKDTEIQHNVTIQFLGHMVKYLLRNYRVICTDNQGL